jgi:PAS domain S-box-containing protein
MFSDRPIRILIVDDSAEDRHTLRRYLAEDNRSNYVILEETLGERGLETFREDKPDCVLLDYRLPDLDGLEFLRQISHGSKTEPLPVIMISGFGNEVTAVEAMKCGASDYMVKGRLTPEMLKKGILYAMEKQEMTRKLNERAFIVEAKTLELERLTHKFQRVAESKIVGLFFFDNEGVITDANETFLHQMGYGLEELVSGRVKWRSLCPLELDSLNEKALLILSDTGTMEPFEQQFLTREGNPVDIYLGLANTDTPRHEGLGLTLDITQRKRFEQALYESEQQLRQSQKMEAIGKLAGGIAHDFNNLLLAIIGFNDISLEIVEKGHPCRENLLEVKKAAERASTLTHQLLAYSRKQVISPKVVNVNEIVQHMDRLFQRVIGEDLQLVNELDPRLWNCRLDPGQFEQVVLNLLVNARDAMPKGGRVVLRTANMPHPDFIPAMGMKPGRYIRVSVVDQGMGIEKNLHSRIFEPFFTTKGEGKGTGLGLSMVYGMVKESDGHILVESEPGRGAAFHIYLPAMEARAALPGSESAGPSGKGKETVLLVEDETTVRHLVGQVLRMNGYNVLEAANGSEALALSDAHQGDIALLLTDVIMAHMGGRELAERLRATRPDIKIVYMSGYTDDAIVRHGVLDARVVFLQKPFSPNNLALKLREVLDSPSAISAPHRRSPP